MLQDIGRNLFWRDQLLLAEGRLFGCRPNPSLDRSGRQSFTERLAAPYGVLEFLLHSLEVVEDRAVAAIKGYVAPLVVNGRRRLAVLHGVTAVTGSLLRPSLWQCGHCLVWGHLDHSDPNLPLTAQ